MSRAKGISFLYDKDKATQIVLWFLHRHGGMIDKLKLVKLLFYADREHLVRYGRPVVGGPYVAMQHGPVSSRLLDDINQAAGSDDLPFAMKGTTIIAKAQVDENELSESDVEVLEYVDRQFGRYDTFRLRDLTHELEAWKKNYPDPEVNTSYPLPYEDFFLDLHDRDMLELIREHQEAMDF